MKKFILTFIIGMLFFVGCEKNEVKPFEGDDIGGYLGNKEDSDVVKGSSVFVVDEVSSDTIYSPYYWDYDDACYIHKLRDKILQDTIHFKYIPMITTVEEMDKWGKVIMNYVDNDTVLFYMPNFKTFTYLSERYFMTLFSVESNSNMYSNVNEDLICKLLEVERLGNDVIKSIQNGQYVTPLYEDCKPRLGLDYKEKYFEDTQIKRKEWLFSLKCGAHTPYRTDYLPF